MKLRVRHPLRPFCPLGATVWRVLGFAVVASAVFAGRATSSDGASELPNYFVAPIKTEVHRTVVAEGASAYAVVSCSDLVVDADVVWSRLDESGFRHEMNEAARGDPSCLRLVLRYQLSASGQISGQLRKSISAKLEEIARSAGFQTVQASETLTSVAWSDNYAGVRDFEEADGVREQIVEDELIRAYPLRTKLSKLAIGHADCVVEIKRPFDRRGQEISNELWRAIKRAVELMGLGPDKGVLKYSVTSTTSGEDVIGRLFDSTPPVEIPPNVTDPALREVFAKRAAAYKPSPGMALAVELGFEHITCAHSPGGGAPEKLIGQPAPNFRLESLSGEELELGSFRNGRPALVTFWGVACGPCCREAPHLTKLHEEYAADFAILAVNGYNESREVVAQYAEETKLAHPIVLNGRSVATDLYHVGAYPTTFWINRQGVVEAYEVGFDSAAALQRRVMAMLGKE